ncbi:hypothetical protein [Chitinophaga barathri]|uniref:Uncharacterized protein n=1 Tax=Chitinophaga barathri TaxID=1647451 RepID=A0A3N4M5N0_9BACT|nr:hypothetical protein [Chitinophaga barathri]RPD38378.1 hypothetical protein EG028_24195 [Chitinophaga barathri]
MKHKSLRERLSALFNVSLPISGGSGETIDEPIIISITGCALFVEVQYHVLELIWKSRGLPWEVHKQNLIEHQDRTIDKLVIKTREVSEDHISYRYENFFFDITDCLETKLVQDNDVI